MQYTESCVCQESAVLYRTQRVSKAENARMQAHRPGQGWEQGFWNHWCGCYRLLEGMKHSVTVMCLPVHSPCVDMCSCESPKGLPVHSPCVDLCSCESPKGCSHTRTEIWIKYQPHLRAVILTPPPPGPAPYSSAPCPTPGITSMATFLKAPYLTGVLRELSVYGVFATCPKWELPSEGSSFHVYCKPHE